MKCIEFAIRREEGQLGRRVMIDPHYVRAVYQCEDFVGIDIGSDDDYIVIAVYEDVIRLLGWEHTPFPL